MPIPARKRLPPPLPKFKSRPRKPVQPCVIIKFNAKTRQEAIERYYPDVTLGGLFIRTPTSARLSPGQKITIRFVLKNGTSYEAQGLIAWVQQKPGHQGLGIKFLHLSFACEQFFGDMLNRRQAAIIQQASRAQDSLDACREELEFSDAPTWRKQTPSMMH